MRKDRARREKEAAGEGNDVKMEEDAEAVEEEDPVPAIVSAILSSFGQDL